jgi:predicted P-loop ATPase
MPRGDKDKLIGLQGPVIVVDSEMSNFGGREIRAIKAFLTTEVDQYRDPYDHTDRLHPRRCIFAGCCNDIAFLHDDTGNRRFWPITIVNKMSLDFIKYIRENRDQLWAEAVHRYKNGETWYLDARDEALAKQRQEDHREEDPLEAVLAEKLGNQYKPAKDKWYEEQLDTEGHLTCVTAKQAGLLCGFEITDKAIQYRVPHILNAINWVKCGRRRFSGENPTTVYVKK